MRQVASKSGNMTSIYERKYFFKPLDKFEVYIFGGQIRQTTVFVFFSRKCGSDIFGPTLGYKLLFRTSKPV